MCLLLVGVPAYVVPETMTMDEKIELYKGLEKNLHGCALHVFSNERGMAIIALKDIAFNEPFMAIPAELTISSFDNFDWYPYVRDGGPEVILIARLIYEKFISARGPWVTEYVHAIPTYIDAVLNWTETEKKELYDHAFHKFSVEMPLPYEAGFVKLSQLLGRVPGIYNTCPHCLYPEVYAWSYLNMFARAFKQTLASWKTVKGYQWSAGEDLIEGAAMYPLLDLVNHGPTPKKYLGVPDFFTIRTQAGKMPAFVMFADRNFPKHSELVWEYGKKSNLELIYGYGFIMERNKHDHFMYDLTSDRFCLGTRVQSNVCRFKIGVETHEDLLLNMIRQDVVGVDYSLPNATAPLEYFESLSEDSEPESRSNFVEAIRRYRQGLQEYHANIAKTWPLRKERREIKKVTVQRTRWAYLFGIAEKLVLLEHLKVMDRLMMKVLLSDLGAY